MSAGPPRTPNQTLQPELSAALSGRYTIERELGRGGMATVYLAEDVRHRRRVAIKVLHPELAAAVGAERFLAEVRTTANLQHPHIVGLIDSGEIERTPYYVMPFVEGESLRERLQRERQLPIDDVVRIVRDVAAALDYAHRHGVVHRDIKPENILLHDGNAVVADFGIALALSSAGGERLTQTGVSIGTPQYMAPEQAMGERTMDARVDVYALGVVTYEMLIGEPPFTGPTMQSIVGRVIAEKARPLTPLRPTVPPWIEQAVLKAIEKLPADRYATAGDFARAVDAPASGERLVAARPERRTATALIAAVALAAVGALGWMIGARGRQPVVSSPPSRLALIAGRLAGAGQISLHRQIAISGDGGTLLYVARGDDGFGHVVRQSLSDPQPTPIANVRNWTTAPTFAADGKSFVGMVNGERQAYRYSIDGGATQSLTITGGYTDFTQIDERGNFWYSPSNGGGLFRVDAGDSTAQLVPRSDGLRLQQVLPDGRHVLVMRQATMQSGPTGILDVQTGGVTPLLTTAVQEVRYAAGNLLYVFPNGRLDAAPFDLGQLKITGAAVTIGTNVSVTGAGVAQMAVARNGTIVYILEEPQSLVLVDRSGGSRQATGEHRNFHGPRFSPDGRRIAVDFNTESGRDVWVVSGDNGATTKVSSAGDGHDVTWTPDGRFITYLSAGSGEIEQIFRKRWDGNDAPEALFSSRQLGFTGMWLPDRSGVVAIVNDLRPGSAADIALIENGARGPARPLVVTQYNDSYPAVSPDGKWFAYVSDQSGQLEVYVKPITGEGEAVQISSGGGSEPAWNPAGGEIFYRSVGEVEPRLMSATIGLSPRLVVGERRALFSLADMVATQPHASYDVSPDGRTFVMVRRTPAERIMVLQNVPALMKR